MNNYLVHIGKKLPELRGILGWSQSKLCDIVGISRPVICSIENNPEKNNKLFTLALYTVVSSELARRRNKLSQIDYDLFNTQPTKFIEHLKFMFNVNKKYLIDKNYLLNGTCLANSRQYEINKYIIDIFEGDFRKKTKVTKEELKIFVEDIIIDQENRILNCLNLNELDSEQFVRNINPVKEEFQTSVSAILQKFTNIIGYSEVRKNATPNIITNSDIKSYANQGSIGITIENIICDLFNLEGRIDLDLYSNKDTNIGLKNLELQLSTVVQEAFNILPSPIAKKDYASEEDFVLKGNKTLSIKFNYGQKVSPSIVGQASTKTFLHHFGDLMTEEFSDNTFKKLVLQNVHKMIPIYLSHLLNSDYLLYIYMEIDTLKYAVINNEEINYINWKRDCFTFTRDTLETWNESTTVKYKDISLGEFQVHRSRNSYKFRFNMKNLLRILELEGINLEN